MTQNYRLASGGAVDRSKPISFTYDGRVYQGFQGDTLASALLANGVMVNARSFKYHRPRGIFSAGSEEPNALVQLEEGAQTVPNCRATQIELYDGLTARSQNCWPSVNFDIGAINNKLSRMLPAGFYYKTFMWPASMWTTYEHVIRKSAGLGIAPAAQTWDPDHYDHQNAHCDVLIVGGGPAGISAAMAATKSDKRVIMIEDAAHLGGALLNEAHTINKQDGATWAAECEAELANNPNVTLLRRTTLTGYFDHNYLIASERKTDHLTLVEQDKLSDIPRERLWKIRAKQVILATGSIERPLVFGDNDRPGVMLANAIGTYAHKHAVIPGEHVVFVTNNDTVYATALAVKALGKDVTVVDIRNDANEDIASAVRQAGINCFYGHGITGVKYSGKLKGVEIAPINEDGTALSGPIQKIACDLVGVAGGWTPTVHLFSQAKGKLRYDDVKHCFVPDQLAPINPHVNVGACNGDFALSDCLADGAAAGLNALRALGVKGLRKGVAASCGEHALPDSMRPLWILPTDHPIGQGKKKHFHELHNDATVADLHLATREGFISVEHTKRYTTTGMGTDQGKTSNVNALNVMSGIQERPIPQIGTTTFRPPYTPLTFGAIVGQNIRELFLQERTTAMQPWHLANGAIFEDVGDWKRPRYFPRDGESMHDAVQRECKALREGVGILDASTLGKIDIQGKDAAKFLNFLYTNAWTKLGIGKCRYGVMLNEHGMVIDDGVSTRLGENHFHMTTTTGGAARVMNMLEEWLQTEWPEMEVYCTSVTEQWSVMAVNGPKSRELLEMLTDEDLSNESFPFMSMKEVNLGGIPAKIYRISFTGELAFEVNVPARYGLAMWEMLMETGKPLDVFAYGTESMHVLRAEKGFIIVGQDTDGTMTPMDLDMDWIVAKKKGDFMGRRSFLRSDTAREGRKQLVGLLTEDPNFVLPEGAHAVEEMKPKPPMKMLGHVTSSYYSPNLGRSIAMACIKNGKALKGQTLEFAMLDGTSQKAEVVDFVFYDKEGLKARG
ncbi:MAG: sarcosine oxidase subunit alpha [Saprospiraceae bacterium]|jgi:sarcosine oxidase subunit alpha